MSACTCPHCKPRTEAIAAEPPARLPVVLPSEARPFRVHLEGGRTQDCTLHPDGRMTMQIGGQTLVNLLTFDEMRERNWANAHIEWDPEPLAVGPERAVAALPAEPLLLTLPAP